MNKWRSVATLLIALWAVGPHSASAQDCVINNGEGPVIENSVSGTGGVYYRATAQVGWKENRLPNWVHASAETTPTGFKVYGGTMKFPDDWTGSECVTDLTTYDAAAELSLFYQVSRGNSDTSTGCSVEIEIPWCGYSYRTETEGGQITFPSLVADGAACRVVTRDLFIYREEMDSDIVSVLKAYGFVRGGQTVYSPALSFFTSATFEADAPRVVSSGCDATVRRVPVEEVIAAEMASGAQAQAQASAPLGNLFSNATEGELDPIGTIEGYVTSADTGLPVERGEVVIYDAVGSVVGAAELINGQYFKEGLEPGSYFVRTEDTGYLDELSDDLPCYFGNCDVTSGVPVEVLGDEISTAGFILEGEGGLIFFEGFEN